ncbi:8079_t:CDS:2, partial [Dentiscutata erythropus]
FVLAISELIKKSFLFVGSYFARLMVGDFYGALKDCEDALLLKENNHKTLFRAGKFPDNNEAKSEIEKIQIVKKHINEAEVHIEKGEYNLAINSIKFNHKKLMHHLNKEAEQVSRELLLVDPNAYVIQAEILYLERKYEQANACCQNVLQCNPDHEREKEILNKPSITVCIQEIPDVLFQKRDSWSETYMNTNTELNVTSSKFDDFPLSENVNYLTNVDAEGFNRLKLKGTFMNDGTTLFLHIVLDYSKCLHLFIKEKIKMVHGKGKEWEFNCGDYMLSDDENYFDHQKVASRMSYWNYDATYQTIGSSFLTSQSKDDQQFVNLPSRCASLYYWNLTNPTYKPLQERALLGVEYIILN